MHSVIGQNAIEQRGDAQAKLRCRGLRKTYGDVVALDYTDIEMRQGEFLTLLGPSGSGKTTLLTLIAGLMVADEGEIWIDGKLATRLPTYARDIGMVFQSYALFPHMTVAENIAFPLRMRRWKEPDIDKAVRQALELVRLGHVGDRFPGELSGGQQQRIALARCVVYRPSIILMDEPLGALDKKLRDQMQFEIKQLQGELNATVLYVTHDQDEAMAMSDRICLMNSGGIEQIGAPAELYFKPVSRFAADFLGESNLLPAEVEGLGPEPTVKVAGRRFTVATAPNTLKAGDTATLMVRPERIALGDPTPGALPGVVTLVTMLGGLLRTVVKLDCGLTITCKSLTGTVRTPVQGERVGIGWNEDAAVLVTTDAVRKR